MQLLMSLYAATMSLYGDVHATCRTVTAAGAGGAGGAGGAAGAGVGCWPLSWEHPRAGPPNAKINLLAVRSPSSRWSSR
jgi:hypothetical protein